MNYGLYLSASGMMTNLYRQDVLAHNLANVQTVGYKPDVPGVRQRSPESIEGGFTGDLSNALLDRLGGGVFAGPQRISFEPGPAQKTGGKLDLMLADKDTFFAVEQRSGKAAAGAATGGTSAGSRVRLTRDGRFQPNDQGYLVTVAGQHYVLDTANQRIQLDGSGTVAIDSTGRVRQGGAVVAQVQVTAVSDKDQLHKQGQNLFAMPAGKDIRTAAADPTVRPGYLEGSGVDPIQAMLKIVDATKAITANGNMIRYHDLLMDRAVNVLGRVVA
jgi:flagellar basal-body rod protein FlgF